MNHENRLSALIVAVPIVAIVLFSVLIIYSFIHFQQSYLDEEMRALEKELFTKSKHQLKEANDAVYEYIVYHREAGFDTMHQQLKERVGKAISAAEKIYEYDYPTQIPNVSGAELMVVLDSMRDPLRNTYFFALDLSTDRFIYFPENVPMDGVMKQTLIRKMHEALNSANEGYMTLPMRKPERLEQYEASIFVRKLSHVPVAIGTLEYLEEVEALTKQGVMRWLVQRTPQEGITLKVHDTSLRLIADGVRMERVGEIDEVVYRQFIDQAKKVPEGSFSQYQWDAKERIGYFRLDDTWQWVIGTSQDVKTIEASIANNKKLLQIKTDKHVQLVVLAAVVLVIVILLVTLYISRSLYDLFEEYREKVKRREWKLAELNRSLEARVKEAIHEAKEKDKAMLNQSRLAQMGEMISMIAHQWRQPLSEVSGIFMEIEAASRFEKLDRPLVERSSQQATKLLDYMSKTIDDFRNFFKPSKAKKRFSVAGACEEALSLAEASLRNSYITHTLIVSEDKEIEGYPSEYAQVVLNILMNAKDVLIERNVKEPNILLHVKVEEGASLVSVCDNGGGVEEGIISHIFDPYVSTKSSSSGTGLGLYMSKMIIEENMQGQLWVENTNEGATFFIKI